MYISGIWKNGINPKKSNLLHSHSNHAARRDLGWSDTMKAPDLRHNVPRALQVYAVQSPSLAARQEAQEEASFYLILHPQ